MWHRHKWGMWSNPITTKDGKVFIERMQVKRCEGCGKVRKRFLW